MSCKTSRRLWYNPLVWIAAQLARQDAELACDEGTIAVLGENERAAYGRTLITMTCAKHANVLSAATTMTDTPSAIKQRILMIAHQPRMAARTCAAALALAVVFAGCTFTGSEKRLVWDEPFQNYDGSIVFTPSVDMDNPWTPLPVVETKPHDMSGEEVQQLVSAFLGDAAFYAYDNAPYQSTRDELAEQLQLLQNASHPDEALIRQCQAAMEQAPASVQRSACTWTYVPVNPDDDRYQGNYPPTTAEIAAMTQIDGVQYRISAQRNVYGETELMLTAYSDVLPLFDVFYGSLCSREEPDEAVLSAVEQRAQNLLQGVEPGSWPMDVFTSERNMGGEHLYCIGVYTSKIVPRLTGEQSLGIPGEKLGAVLYFSGDGTLLSALIQMPREIHEVSEPKLLSMHELVASAKAELKRHGAPQYAIPVRSATEPYFHCTVFPERLTYGYYTVDDPEHWGHRLHIPALTVSGSYKSYADSTGLCEITEHDKVLLVLDARDGSPLYGGANTNPIRAMKTIVSREDSDTIIRQNFEAIQGVEWFTHTPIHHINQDAKDAIMAAVSAKSQYANAPELSEFANALLCASTPEDFALVNETYAQEIRYLRSVPTAEMEQAIPDGKITPENRLAILNWIDRIEQARQLPYLEQLLSDIGTYMRR